jgi:hypothetical protein
MADMGGIIEIIVVTFGIFIFPISAHSFDMHTLKFMFMARIDDSKFFLPQNRSKKLNKWIENTP